MAQLAHQEHGATPKSGSRSAAGPEESLKAIIDRYEQLDQDDSERALALRTDFLQRIKDDPHLLAHDRFSDFLATAVEPEDFARLEWESPSHMRRLSESLYQSHFEDEQLASRVNQHASWLLRRALREYEREGEIEKMFRLLRVVPSYLRLDDAELSRLHHRAVAYEIRRVRNGRRWLYGYLLVQVILILVVFPLLFINAENGRLQRQVEELADVELGDEGYQLLSYSEGVYWAVITAGSIGYGDITPTTAVGRFIAGTLGMMGVITVGIVAGLVLDWITPRQIL